MTPLIQQSLKDRLLSLPDRRMEVAMGEVIQHLTMAHAVLDRGERQPVDESAWAAWARGSDTNYCALHAALVAMAWHWVGRHDGRMPKCMSKVHDLSAVPHSIPRTAMVSAFPTAPLPSTLSNR